MNLGNKEIMMNPSAFAEMIELANKGFQLEKTKATDGTFMVVAKKDGLVRQFLFREKYEIL